MAKKLAGQVTAKFLFPEHGIKKNTMEEGYGIYLFEPCMLQGLHLEASGGGCWQSASINKDMGTYPTTWLRQ